MDFRFKYDESLLSGIQICLQGHKSNFGWFFSIVVCCMLEYIFSESGQMQLINKIQLMERNVCFEEYGSQQCIHRMLMNIVAITMHLSELKSYLCFRWWSTTTFFVQEQLFIRMVQMTSILRDLYLVIVFFLLYLIRVR